jgi:hypothetical protein
MLRALVRRACFTITKALLALLTLLVGLQVNDIADAYHSYFSPTFGGWGAKNLPDGRVTPQRQSGMGVGMPALRRHINPTNSWGACWTDLVCRKADYLARALGGLADAAYAQGKMRSAFEHFSRCVAHEISDWLEGIGLAQYVGAFEANDIDMGLLRQVDVLKRATCWPLFLLVRCVDLIFCHALQGGP